MRIQQIVQAKFSVVQKITVFFGENNNLDKVIVYCPICELKSHGKECTTVSDGEIICSSCYQKNL